MNYDKSLDDFLDDYAKNNLALSTFDIQFIVSLNRASKNRFLNQTKTIKEQYEWDKYLDAA